MRALVTGCAGFIGSHLTESLLQDGAEVVGIDCFNDNYGRPQKLRNLEQAREWERFDFVPIDLSRGDLEDVVHDVDVVFHLAAEPGVRASWGPRFEAYLRNNILATQHLLDAVRAGSESRVVYASSSSIYGQAESFPTSEDVLPKPFSPYGVTKLSAEHLCQLYHANYGVQTVSLRYFSVFGPRQRPDMGFNIFCRAALAGKPLTIFGDGTQTRDFTYVSDVVAATRAAAERPVVGGVYNVGGGSQVSLSRAVELIAEFAGGSVDIEHLPTEHGDVKDTGADVTRARRELRFEPGVAFEDGLREQFEWMLSATREQPPARA